MAGRQRYVHTGTTHFYAGYQNFRGRSLNGDEWFPWSDYDIPYGISLEPNATSLNDVVGNRFGDNPLYLSKVDQKPCQMTYTFEGDIPETEFLPRQQIVVTEQYPFYPRHAVYNGEEDESDVQFVTRAASATNPSRADFDSAVFLGELRDIPKLFQSVGSSMSKFGANEYLKFQYGWKPLVADVRKFMSIVDQVERRLRKIERLQRDGILRTTFKPEGASVKAFKAVTFTPGSGDDPEVLWRFPQESGTNGYGVQVSTQMTTERWCQCIWSADNGGLPPPTDIEQLNLARRAVYGGTVDGNTLWQLMPWSWLLDWTSNASEYLGSQRDVVGAKLSSTVLMKTTKLQSVNTPYFADYPSSSVGSFSFQASPGYINETIKERILDVMPQVEITGELSLLGKSPFKLSILGALGIQRFRGRL
jgi:hypothetical protein